MNDEVVIPCDPPGCFSSLPGQSPGAALPCLEFGADRLPRGGGCPGGAMGQTQWLRTGGQKHVRMGIRKLLV